MSARPIEQQSARPEEAIPLNERPLNAQTNQLSESIQQGLPIETRRRTVLGQLICCQGCCCGRTERGFPPLPIDFLKQKWKSHKLNNTIQLTISGCLGPCDVANVVCLTFWSGEVVWLGGLTLELQYEKLAAWAEQCHNENQLFPLPPEFRKHVFSRFAPKTERDPQCCPTNPPFFPFATLPPEAVVQSVTNATMI